MPKFRKRTDVIEAEQFWPDKKPWPDGVKESIFSLEDGCYCSLCGQHLHLHGGIPRVTSGDYVACVCPGDWIFASSSDGQKSRMRPEDFEKGYEPVEEEKP